MSKISLSPNASGTGTFTIQSPAGNTNRTFTLPDEDGELSVGGGGGGSIDLVASGAISNGDIVGLNVDGTVSTVLNQFPDLQDIDVEDYPAAAYDSVNNKILVVYKKGSHNMYGVVGTISGREITFGPETTVFTHTHFFYQTHLAFDPAAGKFVVLYADGYNAYKMQGNVITITGNTFTVGAKANNLTNTNTSHIRMAYDEDNNRLAAVYRKNGYGAFAALLTISGTTVSLTGETKFGTDSNGNYPSLCYDTDENQFIAYYLATTSVSKLQTFSVSGNTITMNTDYTVNSGAGNSYGIAYDSVNSRFLAVRQKSTGDFIEFVTGTVSGTTITFGIVDSNNAYGGDDIKVFYSPASDNFVVVWDDGPYVATVNIDSGNKIGKIVVEDLSSVDADLTGQSFAAYDSDTELFFLGTDNERGSLFDPTSTINSVVGVASEDIADAATGSITTVGGTTTSLSGLSPSLYQYVQPDATVGTKVTTNRLGLATSATNLVVTL